MILDIIMNLQHLGRKMNNLKCQRHYFEHQNATKTLPTIRVQPAREHAVLSKTIAGWERRYTTHYLPISYRTSLFAKITGVLEIV